MAHLKFRTKVCLLAVLLLPGLKVLGQNVTLEGIVLSKDNQPLQGATIEYSEDQGVTTDSNGVFSIKPETAGPYNLIIRSLGYEQKDTLVNLEEGKNYLVLVLEDKIYSQEEVVVTEKANSIFKEDKWKILDFRIYNSKIYLLYLLKGQRYLGLASLEGWQEDEVELKTKYLTFYESCSERLYLKENSSLIEVGEKEGKLALLGKSVGISDYEKFMQPCLRKIDEEYVFKAYKDHNKRVLYYRYDDDKKQKLIHAVFDADAYKVARSYYWDVIRLYYRYVSDPNGNGIDEGMERVNIIEAGEWDGKLMSLILNNEMQFAVSYYQNVELKELDAHEFVYDDRLYIMDTHKKKILRYNGSTNDLRKLKLIDELDWENLKSVRVDKALSKVYLLSGKKDLYELKFEGNQVEVVELGGLEKGWRAANAVSIHDGVAYYYFQRDATKLETTLKKEILISEN
ncbi:MAG: carboxypeptidase-like regulatory domain-containing protein [Phaeodactylibacter sp.]|nr:carboxypeptidase-like regulatory domain-containing protein [Phaeodactylibacter sp.]